MIRDLEDDGTRTRHAKMHSSSCPAAPVGEPRLEMVSLDHLKMLAADDTLWFEIVRTEAEEDGRQKRRGSA
ncbi:MAG TPA: hypothetical protein VJM31_18615 [Vicinamibacterales bacterium]|nr:hypothetical protein [Vicinamibacterales bacterium]